MASKSYFIELIVNFNDQDMKGKEAVIKAAAARMAKGLLTTAMLISDRTTPRLSMYSTDAINGTRDIDLDKFDTSGPCPACGHMEEPASVGELAVETTTCLDVDA